MASHSLALRIFDFLKNYPPFNMLTQGELLTVCENIQVSYFDTKDVIFNEGENPENLFYVVAEGAVALYRYIDQAETLIDICDEGDAFGLRPLINHEKYLLTAKAIEECILYGVSIDLFKDIYDKNPKVSNYLISCFASYHHNLEIGTSEVLKNSTPENYDYLDLKEVNIMKKPAQCPPDKNIMEAAALMTRKKTGCLVVVKSGLPLGIITDRDIRSKVATGKFEATCKVSDIMSSPVKTFSQNISIVEAQMAMLNHSIGHLCITKDGTTDSKVIGVVSDRDVLVLQGNSPTVLMREIKRTDNVKSLRLIRQAANKLLESYLNQNIPILLVSKIISDINDGILKRVIELSLEDFEKPPCKFTWMSIGSQGRQEQLLMTDQDHALVFENVSSEKHQIVKDYFLKLAKSVSKSLNIIGFEYCGAGMMASDPRWCLSLEEWQNRFYRWINEPGDEEIMMSSIFFDYRPVFGDFKLTDALTDYILNRLDKNEVFLTSLGNNTLRKPTPLGFFRQFLLEKDGEHKDSFDIKVRALMPLIDAARMLILEHGVRSFNNTIQRYEKLCELEPQNRELYQECIEAFRVFLHYRTKQGLANKDSGRFIKLENLTKMDRVILKNSFSAISDIQEVLKIRFKLYYF
ncbi:MAG: DUF294 nucleotidyltransferase-like domain-containing protein [Flavobacteriaceae bacterium]|nr:DUF294 nucleotidyltransferase-like domain-containing protein [Flavobacteriaceae bacterium]